MIAKYLAFIFIIISFLISSKGYVLMISFDGFRYDYTQYVSTPNFDSIEAKGVKAKSLIPVFPSLTFPNHYSIATGSYSGNHNIIANHFYDKFLDSRYSMYDSESVSNGNFYSSEPIWVTAERNSYKSATFFWIGSEAEINGYRPSIYKKYNPNVTYTARVDSVFKWLSLDFEKRPSLVMLYFNEPDRSGHIYGSSHSNTFSMVTKMDSILGYIEKNISKLDIKDSLDVIIVSDHGMVDVSVDKTILIDNYIELDRADNVNGGGALMLINSDNSQLINQFYLSLKKVKNLLVYKRDNIPERYNYLGRSTPDILLLADEGWFITTEKDFLNKKKKPLGMHGYDSIHKSMHGIFYAYGPSFKDGYIIDSFENIHIYPIICEILNINPYIKSDGEHDWKNHIKDSVLK